MSRDLRWNQQTWCEHEKHGFLLAMSCWGTEAPWCRSFRFAAPPWHRPARPLGCMARSRRQRRRSRWPVTQVTGAQSIVSWQAHQMTPFATVFSLHWGTKIQTSGIWSHSRGSPCVNLAIENGVPPCIYRCMSHHLPSSPTMFPL